MQHEYIKLADWNAVLEYIDSNRYQIPMSTVEYLMGHSNCIPKLLAAKDS